MISIVIPTLNEEAGMASLLEWTLALPGEKEIIVSDGGSTDDTPVRVGRYPQVRLLCSDPGRARQLNAGAAVARGAILLFLHADTRLPRQGLHLVHDHLRRKEVAGGSFALRFDHPHPLLRFQAWCSRINHSYTTFGDQALFLRAKTFRELGGFPDQPLLEDWELQHRLRRCGRFVKIRDQPVTTSARRFLARGVWKQSLQNVYLFTRYQLGGDVQDLARRYRVGQTG